MTTPLSDERLAELRRLAALGLRAQVPCTVPAQALTDLLAEVDRLRTEVVRLMTGLTDIGQVATYPADTGYAERDPWDVLWAIAQATCQLTCGKAHKLWEATNDDATE